MTSEHKTNNNQAVAIIGMGCLFPKSAGLKDYWRLLFHGQDAITDVPASHWLSEDYYDKDPKKPDHVYCKRGGFLSPVSFDPAEFGIPPTSLEATDTSQLLGLMVAKKALEDAGYGDDRDFIREKTSVILGVTGTQELVIPLGARLGHPIWKKALINSGISPQQTEKIIQDISDSYVSWQENSFPGLLGNVVAGRISNRLDLGGTNCVVDAACASSLSAVHLAIMELTTKRADMVVTGGVDTLNDIFMHMCFAKTMVLSPTGDIRPFSKDADGTILGEGIGMFVLKRLEDAETDGDRIYGVIKGMGTSSDGKSQSIYAPRAQGQAMALRMAYAEADIEPSTIELLEAHGTGTRIGDIVEFQALNRLFGQTDQDSRRCALGSVKSMIGHTKAAAGAAGLMKAVLSLHNKVLLPTIKADKPDPQLNIHQSPFYLNTVSRPWFSKKAHPRRSGVSAFGFGGSNFHIVVEEYRTQKHEIAWDGAVDIVALSNDNQTALKDRLIDLKTAIDGGASYEAICRKAEKTKTQFSASDPHRMLIVVERSADLPRLFNHAVNVLESDGTERSKNTDNVFYGNAEDPGKLAFVFPGQGSQYVNMVRDIVCTFPEAFNTLEKANEQFDNVHRLTDWIYPFPPQNNNQRRSQDEALRQTDIAQPAIGAVSASMVKVLHRFGIQPDVTCGHSFGELTALFAAGWIDLKTFLHLAVSRGRLMAAANRGQSQQKGGMLAVKAPLERLESLISETNIGVILANRNSPEQGVLSGPLDAIEKIRSVCENSGFKTARLPVSAAFHSDLVRDAQEPFMQILSGIVITPTDIPVFSNTTGMPYPADSNKAKTLLGKHLLNPVDFVREIENAFHMGVRTFVEVGPKSVFTSLIKSTLKDGLFHAIALDDSSGRKPGMTDLARAICQLASMGHPVDLASWEPSIGKQRKKMMSIPITGTNYKKSKPLTDGKASATGSRQAARNNPQQTKTYVNQLNTADHGGFIATPESTNTNRKTMDKDSEKHHPFILDALTVVQKGLGSMQALQTQTAKAHQKFLETQTEANRALQKMMDNIQRLVEASLNTTTDLNNVDSAYDALKDKRPDSAISETSFSTPTIQHPSQHPVDDVQPPYQPGKIPSAPEPAPTITAQEPTYPRQQKEKDPDDKAKRGVEHDLLTTVSQLTGYPIETLDLDMDIEADLGIDSIKRVEILSSLEEQIPSLPPISPEVMGGLKTLGQIIETIENASGAVVVPEPEPMDAPNRQSIENLLLETVGRLTGYPVEMLGLDMNIEADLGIDSIKRVEILSSLEEEIPNLPTLSPEIMGEIKTLGQIVEVLSNTPTSATPQHDTKSAYADKTGFCRNEIEVMPDASTSAQTDVSAVEFSSHVERRVVSLVKQPLEKNNRLSLAENRKVFITDDNTDLSDAIARRLNSMNIETAILSSDRSLVTRMAAEDVEKAAGLIIISNSDSHNTGFLKDAFLLTNRMASGLLQSGSEGGALFATITRLDGAFGFKNRGLVNPMQGGLAGLSKTAAREWENVFCHALDISPDWKDNDRIAATVVDELLYAENSGPNEIGLDADTRWTLALEPACYPQGTIDISQKDVIVVTGGARGVTASAVVALAKQTRPTLALLGRSPYPTPEPEWLAPLENEGTIKKAILDHDFNGQKASPLELEKAYKAYMANREITNNLNKIAQTGANVHYYDVDIRDAGQVKQVLDDIRSVCGAVKGIVHGAGILEDRWIVDKTLEQFETVFDTKVKGLCGLLEATQQDRLKYLVLFSSVAARFGNNGQVDYAMANEVLNKMAQQESITRPDCKVIAINWGPWDGGMVCAALKKKFNDNGVSLIPMDAGARCMLNEMMGDKNQPVEVVIGANVVSGKKKSGVQNIFKSPAQRAHTREKEAPSLTVRQRFAM